MSISLTLSDDEVLNYLTNYNTLIKELEEQMRFYELNTSERCMFEFRINCIQDTKMRLVIGREYLLEK